MTITAALEKHVVQTPFESFSEGELDRARNRIIDVAGHTLAGANAPGCSMVLDMMEEWGGRKQSTVFRAGAINSDRDANGPAASVHGA